MEQEVPVTFSNPAQGPEPDETATPQAGTATPIPEPVRELTDAVTDAYERFKDSESYDAVLEGVNRSREYIRNNPGPAMLWAAGAGLFLGLLLGKRR